jgi:hypothetical protein
MQNVPYARIDFEASGLGGVAGKLGICPYAAVFQSDDSGEARSVTDYFVPQDQLWKEIEALGGLPMGTEITPALVEAIGVGCQELGGNAVARLQWVSGVPLASPRLAEDVLMRRGFPPAEDGPDSE